MKGFAVFFATTCAIIGFLCWYSQYNYDFDNFYHLGHANLYWQKGPAYRPFPWVTYSVISQHNSDMWWGFHLLLTPLWVLRDPVWVLGVAPAFLLLLHVLIARLALVRLKISQWYALAVAFGSMSFFTRMDTVRPQALSSVLLLLVFSALVTGAPWLAIGASALLGFLHPTLSYMVILVALATILTRRMMKGEWSPWVELSCVAVALTVAVLRPGIPDGLALLKVQLIDLMIAKKAGAIPNFGSELSPVEPSYFIRSMLGPTVVFVISLFFALRSKREKDGHVLASALLISLGAIGVSMLITRRGVDQFVPFAITSSLLLIRQTGGFNFFAGLIFASNSLISAGGFVWQHHQRKHKLNAIDFRGASEWLIANTQKGEIVGQAVWSEFGPLFFWNQHNRFFGGMDPIFQYTYSKETYWAMSLTAPMRIPGQTGTDDPKKLGEEEPISIVYPKLFKTRWLITHKFTSPAMQDALKEDPKVKIRFEDDYARVYEFLP
jgi:hypothetical protein